MMSPFQRGRLATHVPTLCMGRLLTPGDPRITLTPVCRHAGQRLTRQFGTCKTGLAIKRTIANTYG